MAFFSQSARNFDIATSKQDTAYRHCRVVRAFFRNERSYDMEITGDTASSATSHRCWLNRSMTTTGFSGQRFFFTCHVLLPANDNSSRILVVRLKEIFPSNSCKLCLQRTIIYFGKVLITFSALREQYCRSIKIFAFIRFVSRLLSHREYRLTLPRIIQVWIETSMDGASPLKRREVIVTASADRSVVVRESLPT